MDVGVELLHNFKQAVALLLSSNCGAKQKWPRTVNKKVLYSSSHKNSNKCLLLITPLNCFCACFVPRKHLAKQWTSWSTCTPQDPRRNGKSPVCNLMRESLVSRQRSAPLKSPVSPSNRNLQTWLCFPDQTETVALFNAHVSFCGGPNCCRETVLVGCHCC